MCGPPSDLQQGVGISSAKDTDRRRAVARSLPLSISSVAGFPGFSPREVPCSTVRLLGLVSSGCFRGLPLG